MTRRLSSPLLRPSSRRTGAPSRPARRALVAVPTGLALALGLGACSATNPITTTNNYAPSDGIMLRVGDLRGNNLLVLTAEEGAPGVLIGGLTNDGTEAATITMSLSDAAAGGASEGATGDVSVTVPPGGTVLLDPDGGETVEVDAVPAPPGALVQLTISTDGIGTLRARVPVLDGTLPPYAPLVPQG